MRQLLRYNFVALPLLITAVVGLVVCLLLSGHASLWWLGSFAPVFMFLTVAAFVWLAIKLAMRLMKPPSVRLVTAAGLLITSVVLQRGDIATAAIALLLASSTYWWARSQVRGSPTPATREDTLYWYWVTEFTDGRTPFLPRKPRR